MIVISTEAERSLDSARDDTTKSLIMERYELQKLRDLSIIGVAERLGLTVKGRRCLCPFHADHHPSMSLKASKNTYRCFVCGASGDNISLVMG